MNILYDVLNELGYESEDEFQIAYSFGDDDISFTVHPFVTDKYANMAFLSVQMDVDLLPSIIESDFISEIAKSYRLQGFFDTIMDKNTSLIIETVGEANDDCLRAQVLIEDDPYYFKKYVFISSRLEYEKAYEFFKDRKSISEHFSYVETIRSYISDTDMFENYESNMNSEPCYHYLAELVSKLPVFPLSFDSGKSIESVDSLYAEYTSDSDIDTKQIETFVNIFAEKELSIDEIIDRWNSCKSLSQEVDL